MNTEEVNSLEKINLTDIKIISTTGTPSDVVVICGNKQLGGIKAIKFEINPNLLVGKVTLEIITKDVIIDAKNVEVNKIEVKE